MAELLEGITYTARLFVLNTSSQGGYAVPAKLIVEIQPGFVQLGGTWSRFNEIYFEAAEKKQLDVPILAPVGSRGASDMFQVGILGGGQYGPLIAQASVPLSVRDPYTIPITDPPLTSYNWVTVASPDWNTFVLVPGYLLQAALDAGWLLGTIVAYNTIAPPPNGMAVWQGEAPALP